MIYDTLEQLPRYAALYPAIAEAVTFFQELAQKETLPKERIDYSDRVYAVMQEYETKREEDCDYEGHQVCIDVQIILEGSEEFQAAPLGLLKETKPYCAETDCAFYTGEPQAKVHLFPGMFAIVFPSDGHKPGLIHGTPTHVRKMIIKTKV